MRVAVCGSKQWHDRPAIRRVLTRLRREAQARGEEFVVIHSASPDGADLITDQICTSEFGMTPGEDLIREPVQWKRYQRIAAPMHNRLVLERHQPTLVYAFHCGGKTAVTDDMVERARKAGVPTRVVTPEACVNA